LRTKANSRDTSGTIYFSCAAPGQVRFDRSRS
jgi:hypothetical protein